MPIYEYKCENCGEVFEVRQKFSDEPVTIHEKCGGKVDKLLSAPSFQFKGSGWYVTDYGKGNNGAKKSEKNDSESKNSSDTSVKTESKSADTKSAETKTESKPAASESSSSTKSDS
jgi:putative FmdB family regulatory protein